MASDKRTPATCTGVWATPANAANEDAACATFTGSGNLATSTLTAKNFGFAIPANARITGIRVRVKSELAVSGPA